MKTKHFEAYEDDDEPEHIILEIEDTVDAKGNLINDTWMFQGIAQWSPI